MEILSPAGSREALERAQAAGADAVYLGYSAFSARAGAGNFDLDQLREALRFAHLRHLRVYVTVNTLVKDQELPEVYQLLRTLRDLRVDGILVQDLGVLRMARACFPGLRVHASTQMAIHNETGVRWCAGLGLTRVVLARECSLEEIRRCVRTGMEIEVFGHGAQCVCVSGECLFSSMVGDRSGNRGRCAQPCRKRYRLAGRAGAWLSPRDLCLRDRIPELQEAGVSSLKIEGRLKRPEYVYTVTESYRQGLNSCEQGDFRPAEDSEKDALRQVFHRGGFMEGYAFGAEDAGVIFPDSVHHQGLPLGEVISRQGDFAQVQLTRELHDGDGLRIQRGSQGAEMAYSGKDMPAGEVARIRLRSGMQAKRGDEVWRLTDARLMAEALAAPISLIPVDMALKALPGEALRLRLSDGETEVSVTGNPVETARSRETTVEDMARQLRKTGGTDFAAREVRVDTQGAFVPLSALNELRREGLEKLAEARMNAFAYPAGPVFGTEALHSANEDVDLPEPPPLMVTLRKMEQAEVCRRQDVRIIWYPEDFRPEALRELNKSLHPGDWLRLPEVCEEDTLQTLRRFVEEHQSLLGGVLLGSVGQLGISWPVAIAAGPGIPVMNREAARMLRQQGCAFAMISPELTGEEIRTLTAPGKGLLPLVLPAYGRTQLMLLHHCPARTVQGWSQGHAGCTLCDQGDSRALRGKHLEDERGYRFPLQRVRLPEGCLVRLLNDLPTDLGEKRISLPRMAEMTTESGEEAGEILTRMREYQRTEGKSTRGHWNRPIL